MNIYINVIVPIYDKTFIYDNAANRIGKGIDHTMNRVNCHMQRHFRKYGLNGYIVSCDIYTNIVLTPLDHYIKDKLKDKKVK